MIRRGTMGRRLATERPGNSARRSWLLAGPEETRDPHARDERTARVEAALFLADEPLSLEELARAASLETENDVIRYTEKLQTLLQAEGSPLQVERLAGGYRLLTRAEFHPWLRRTAELKLTPSALETLTVIAYKQPITRADLEELRGTVCAEPLKVLLDKGLIKIVGRDNSLGRPQLYGTSALFLEQFGFDTLDDLPPQDGISRRK